jgi:transposase
MIIHPEYIGIDVSKDHLDIFDAASGRSERIANASEPIAALVARWQGRNVFVVFEATGHYDRTLRTALAQSGIRYARINPARARDFARARGLLGKTDAIDARMLAALGQGLSPAAQAPIDLSRDELALAHKRRDQLVHVRQKERTRRSECSQAELAADIDAHLAWLDARSRSGTRSSPVSSQNPQPSRRRGGGCAAFPESGRWPPPRCSPACRKSAH